MIGKTQYIAHFVLPGDYFDRRRGDCDEKVTQRLVRLTPLIGGVCSCVRVRVSWANHGGRLRTSQSAVPNNCAVKNSGRSQRRSGQRKQPLNCRYLRALPCVPASTGWPVSVTRLLPPSGRFSTKSYPEFRCGRRLPRLKSEEPVCSALRGARSKLGKADNSVSARSGQLRCRGRHSLCPPKPLEADG